MITDEMTLWMIRHVANLPPPHPHVAIFDWIVLGRYTGFRASEWCQTTKSNFKRNNACPSLLPEAFIEADFTFFQDGEIPVLDISASLPAPITSVRICWRTQKNKQNGETIPFYRDATNPSLCPVAAALRIVHRARHLHKQPGLPLGVRPRSDRPSHFQYITTAETAAFLRLAAQEAHKLPAKHPDISAWSAHSIRVTAANLLHRAKFSDSFIQNRLRWRSNTFLMYLRNTFYSARSHTTALALDLHGLQSPSQSNLRPPEPHEHLANISL